jgi:hypothetical protein
MNVRTPAILLIALAACKPPPPAPQGLNDTTRYLYREFWSDDATFQAGIQGFYDWFENGGGKELVGIGACLGDDCGDETSKPTDAFTIDDLTDEDVAAYPLDDQIILEINDPDDPADDVLGPRDITGPAGVVSLAEMDCSWTESEALLVRRDQNTVFPKDWEGYDRKYLTPRETFEAAAVAGTFTEIPERIDPYAEDFDLDAYGDTVLFTRNTADPTSLMGVNLPGYPLNLEFRQGTWDIVVDGEAETVSGFAIITYDPGAVWGPDGTNGLRQEYSVEVNLSRPNDKTLRMLAVWAEPISPIISADATLSLNYAVNKSLTSSNLLSDICSGEVEVADEPPVDGSSAE